MRFITSKQKDLQIESSRDRATYALLKSRCEPTASYEDRRNNTVALEKQVAGLELK